MSFLAKLKSFFAPSSDTATATAQQPMKQSARNTNGRTTNRTNGRTNGSAKSDFQGTVRYFNRNKGYGFIHKNENNEKVFVHISDLKDRIKVGDNVHFSIETTDKGPRARQVSRMKN